MTLPEFEFTPQNPDFHTISDYEAWASQNWLHQQGTLPAQVHARQKFEEEIQELSEAVDSGVAEDIISEAGDVLWTATASASNAGVSLSESLRWYIPERFDEGDIDLELVDTVARERFVDFDPIYQHNALSSLRVSLGKSSQQWFNLKHHVDVAEPGETFSQLYISLKQDRTQHGLAMTTLLCSAIAQEAGSSLTEVMRANAAKLNKRIAEGKPITKTPTM